MGTRGLWALLLGAYWLLLAATVLATQMSRIGAEITLLVLAAGIPVYVLAAHSIARTHASSSPATSSPEEDAPGNVIPIAPYLPSQTSADIAQASAEARASYRRKLG